MNRFKWILSALVVSSALFGYTSFNSKRVLNMPIDGGRELNPVLDPVNNVEILIGYLGISSIDSEGGLNPAQDQQDANMLRKQILQLYIDSYQKYGAMMPNNPPHVKNTPSPSTQTSCQMRRSAKWRNQP